MELPGLAVGHFRDGQPEAAQNVQIDSRIAAHVGDAAEQKDRHIDAPLPEGACDDEAVTAVVAAAAQYTDAASEHVAVDRLDCGNDLPAGILHQHDGRNPDLVYGPPIGFAHLRGIQNAHTNLVIWSSGYLVI